MGRTPHLCLVPHPGRWGDGPMAQDAEGRILRAALPAAADSPPTPILRAVGPVTTTGATVWLTGLPAAGKSTIARALARRLRSEGRSVAVLDGDLLRRTICADLGDSVND